MNTTEQTMHLWIHAVAHGGDGLGRLDEGQVCFVPFALPGDRVRVRIQKRSATATWARLLEVVTPSPHRTEFIGDNPAMAEAYIWGCFGYPEQGEWKHKIVAECLRRIGKIETEVEWVEDPGQRLGYRTRAEFHGDGTSLGLYAAESNRIVPMTRCPLCSDAVNSAYATLAELRVRGSVMITAHPDTDQVMVWSIPSELDRVREAFPLANALGDGRPRAVFEVDGVPVVNGAFCQSSLTLNRILLRVVSEMAGNPASVLDLYCGNGNLSLWLARRGARVEGYDHAPEAVQAADALGLGRYHRGGEVAMAEAVARGGFETVILDPPRSGALALVPVLEKSDAERIVYVSCDPATLARDLKLLALGGWRPERVVGLDLFPQTPHVETVCLLRRESAEESEQ